MTDEFTNHFGQLAPAPRHPNSPNDPELALYDVHTGARRFTFENRPDGAHAIDVKSGEAAFRITAAGKTILPNGKELPTPKIVARPPAPDMAQRLYGKPAATPAKRAALAAKTMADRL